MSGAHIRIHRCVSDKSPPFSISVFGSFRVWKWFSGARRAVWLWQPGGEFRCWHICGPKGNFQSGWLCVFFRSAPEKEGPAVTSACWLKAPSAATGSAATIARYVALDIAVAQCWVEADLSCATLQMEFMGVVCRDAVNDCDIPENCTGDSSQVSWRPPCTDLRNIHI